MRAAAKFGGKISDLNHAHLVAILLAKQRHRVILIDSHVNRNIFDNFYFFVAQNFLVDDVFNILQLLVGDSSKVRKIKPQMIGSNERPRLLHMLPENFAQPRLK